MASFIIQVETNPARLDAAQVDRLARWIETAVNKKADAQDAKIAAGKETRAPLAVRLVAVRPTLWERIASCF